MLRVAALGMMFLLPVSAAAQDKAAGKKLAERIAPLLDELTVAVAHVDITKIDVSSIVKELKASGKLNAELADKAHKQLNAVIAMARQAGVTEVYAVSSLADIPFEAAFLAIPAENEADAAKISALLKQLARGYKLYPSNNLIVVGKENVVARLKKLKPASPPLLAEAFSAVSEKDAKAVVVVPRYLQQSLQEVLPHLPPDWGGYDTGSLLEGLQWAAAGLSFQAQPSLDLIVQASNAKVAQSLKKLSLTLFNKIKKEARDKEQKQLVDLIVKLLTPKVSKNQLSVSLTSKEALPLLLALAEKSRFAAGRAQSLNNLKQIGVALHNYHDVHKFFPAQANYDKNGKPLLSWRVHILPYVEQHHLYKQFKLDEPWDSPHNKKLIKHMPEVFRSPLSKAHPHKTTYLAPHGKGLFFDGKKGRPVKDFRDGTSNSIMVLEADDSRAVIWTKPDDLKVDRKNPWQGLGGNKEGSVNTLFADGSVRSLNKEIGAGLNSYLTVAGGEVTP